MSRIRYYGPSLVLSVTVLAVLLIGPQVMKQLVFAQQEEQVRQSRELLLEQAKQLAELSNAFRAVARTVKPSVVHLEVSMSRSAMIRRFERERGIIPHGRDRRGNDRYEDFEVPEQYGNGSGWVYDDAGHIITNYHVVDGAEKIVVKFFDKTTREATLVGKDMRTDIAVLKVEGDGLHPAKLADFEKESERIAQGDIVFAFGSPFRKEFSMSQGIVSGTGRTVGILGTMGYEDFIQTDAAIHPGNSGGPLTNIYGEVVGMNTAIATNTGIGQGVGFAIPANMLRHHIESLIENRQVRRGYLGVLINTLTADMGTTFGYDGRGVLVEKVLPDGPAGAAGIRRGDIIVAVNGEEIATDQELRLLIASYDPDTAVTVTVVRDGTRTTPGQRVNITVTLEQLPETDAVAGILRGDREAPEPPQDERMESLRQLGIEELATLSETLADRMDIEHVPGVIIERVRSRSIAAAEGLARGMIITDVMGEPVSSLEELLDALEANDLGAGVRITVRQGDMYRYAILKLPDVHTEP